MGPLEHFHRLAYMSITSSCALSTVTTNGLINTEISKNAQKACRKKLAFLEGFDTTDKFKEMIKLQRPDEVNIEKWIN